MATAVRRTPKFTMLSLLLISSALVFNVIDAQASPTPACANRWHHNTVTDTCIRVVNKKKDFNTARGVCQSMGGDLAHSVLTKTHRKFINKLLRYRGNFWIGAKDGNNDGSYDFLDGRTMNSKAPFKRGMPRPGAHKTCVSYKNVWGGRWINRSCKQRTPFICEKPPNVVQIVPDVMAIS